MYLKRSIRCSGMVMLCAAVSLCASGCRSAGDTQSMQKSPYAVTGKATKKLAGKDSERLEYEQYEGFFYVKTGSGWGLAKAEDYKKITKQHCIPRKSTTTKDVAKPIKETAKPNEDTAQKKQEAKAKQAYYDSEEWQKEYTELTKDVKPNKKRGFFSALAFWRGSDEKSEKREMAEDIKPKPYAPKKAVEAVKPVAVKPAPAKKPEVVAAAAEKPSPEKTAAKPAADDKKEEQGSKRKEKKGFFSFLGLPGSGSGDKPEAGKPVAEPVAEPVAGKDADKPETIQAAESKAPESVDKPDQETAEKGAVVKPGYVLKIVVMASGRKEVDEPNKRISAEGILTLPLIGRVEADGLTILELSDKLVDLYSKYLREPMVDVDFVLSEEGREGTPWGFVTVLGRVQQPGRVAVPPTQDLTLSTAIQMAGGFDKSAKMTGIKITREKNGKTEQLEIDLQSIGDAGKIENDIPLLPGDFVFVPERFF